MNAEQEATRPLWLEDAPLPSPDPLAGNAVADVVVVGAGMAGLSTAYELAREGRSVVVLDRGRFGGGMTARTTAHLASALDDFYHVLINRRGEDVARRYAGAQHAAIARIGDIAAAEAIACDFRRVDGYLVTGEGMDASIIDREADACVRIGFDVAERLQAPGVPGGNGGPCIRFREQARFHPLKYVAGLVAALERLGVRMHARTPVDGVRETGGRVFVSCGAMGEIEAAAAVVATNAPVNDRLAIHAKMAPYRTYVVAFDIAPGAFPDILLWDTLDPYHYARLQERAGGWALIVGGADHKTGMSNGRSDPFHGLVDWARRHVPEAGPEIARWSGQVMEPLDGLPFSGRSPGQANVYVHTGDSGQGMTNAVLGAGILRDLMLCRESPLAEDCEPTRTPLRALGEVVSENLTVTRNFAGRLAPGELRSADEARPGEGGLLRSGLRHLAVSRDLDGTLHVVTATCSHAGCLVHWNGVERCWDCPCHGSHFAPDGSVLNAPALGPLAAEPPGDDAAR